jgi:recombination protein RecT
MDANRVVRLARLAVHRQPALQKCDPVSVIESIMMASQLGLEINSPTGGAHLVTFGDKCQMIPDYRGLIDLAIRGGSCRKLIAHEVYQQDHFDVMQGTEDKIVHIPALTAEERVDDDLIAFYAVAVLKDGDTVHEVASLGDIHKLRDRRKEGGVGAWKTDFVAMGKKSMIKRLCKWLKMSPELAVAVEIDNQYESGKDDPASVSAEMARKARRQAVELKEELEQQAPEGDA